VDALVQLSTASNNVETTRLIASGSFDNSIRLWAVPSASASTKEDLNDSAAGGVKKRRTAMGGELTTISTVYTLLGHAGPVSALCSARSELYSASWDHTVRRWDVETGLNTQLLSCDHAATSCSLQTVDGGLLASGHTDGLVRLWDPRVQEGSMVRRVLKSHSRWVAAVEWSPQSAFHLVSAGYDGTLKWWDLRGTAGPIYSVRPTAAAAAAEEKLFCARWGGDGHFVVSGGEDCHLRIHSFQLTKETAIGR
jgi:ribosome biogenesis protein YTM1